MGGPRGSATSGRAPRSSLEALKLEESLSGVRVPEPPGLGGRTSRSTRSSRWGASPCTASASTRPRVRRDDSRASTPPKTGPPSSPTTRIRRCTSG
ncbi:MAG: hypothetical protein MZU95_05300 [Desulfomicrobium escambiense]|nr:hypothetical protein [Desulfomicrobium escambiense]